MFRSTYSDQMKLVVRAFRALLVPILLTASVRASEATIDQRVDHAVDLGVEYLLTRIDVDGWVVGANYPQGYTALQVYALLKSDVSHRHPLLQRGLRAIADAPLEKVYSVSLAVMAYGAVLEQMKLEEIESDAFGGSSAEFFPEKPKKHHTAAFIKKKLKEAVAWLVRSRIVKEGCWTYEPSRPRRAAASLPYDHSNTQFAILALGIAEKHGVSSPRKVWDEIADHFVRCQEKTGPTVETRATFATPGEPRVKSVRKRQRKGTRVRRAAPLADIFDEPPVARGWTYRMDRENPPTFSMTSAGLSSAILAHRRFSQHGRGSVARALEVSIRDGLGWIARHLRENRKLRFDPYSLYSLEKVGDLGFVETIDGFSWYERGAEPILGAQGDHGGWGPLGSEYSRHATALCLLFLGRATALESRVTARITGARRDAGFSTRYVVYIPSLDRAFPIIELFRRLRYSPTSRLVGALDELVEVYDPDYTNELARFLLTLRRSPARLIREKGDALLARVTGIESPELAPYLEFDSDWERLVRTVIDRAVGHSGWVRSRLSPAKCPVIRLKAIWAVQSLGDQGALGELIECLKDDNPRVRVAAYDALVVISGQRLAFDPKSGSEQRDEDIARWVDWWRAKTGKDTTGDDPKE